MSKGYGKCEKALLAVLQKTGGFYFWHFTTGMNRTQAKSYHRALIRLEDAGKLPVVRYRYPGGWICEYTGKIWIGEGNPREEIKRNEEKKKNNELLEKTLEARDSLSVDTEQLIVSSPHLKTRGQS